MSDIIFKGHTDEFRRAYEAALRRDPFCILLRQSMARNTKELCELHLTKGEKIMDKETIGTVLSVAKQWWLKVNTKPIRMGVGDGATFPHIIKVQYAVDGNNYTKRKWIGAGKTVPEVGSKLTVLYRSDKPSKAKIL